MLSRKPAIKPKNPCFSSGPCAKHPGFRLCGLNKTPLGRSHRSALGKSRLLESINKTKELLGIPDNYAAGIVPASDTGAMEMAMWNLLGARGVDVIFFESFGKTWAEDISKELKLQNVNLYSAEYGELPDLTQVNFNNDVVFTWNGTTSGVKIPDGEFIPEIRGGLTICDATSAVFAMDIPWTKLDVVTFSWQKVLGGEAAHGMLVLSPRAVERLENYKPSWPIPKIFRLSKGGKMQSDIFKGSTINTPSMLCNEDYLDALNWAEAIGGLPSLIKRSTRNLQVIEDFVEKHEWIHFLAAEKEIRSNTSVCLSVNLSSDKLKKLVTLMDSEQVAYDIASYRDAPDGLRFWCGATVEMNDLEIALQWLEWAYNEVNLL